MENFIPVSVLMSVYYKEKAKNLNESLKSIYEDQTYKPDEIILIQDGPISDELHKTIEKWKNKLGSKLNCIILEKNSGLAAALNLGLFHCKNKYVARMDSDDIALPERLEKQYLFLESNPEISVISGQIEEWNEDFSKKISVRKLPCDHNSLRNFIKLRSPISHPAALFIKDVVINVGGYPNIYPEDYALWSKLMIQGIVFANLPETILKMRISEAIQYRRGLEFLKGEIQVYQILKSGDIINSFEYYTAIAKKSFIRLSPRLIKILAYKFLR